MKKLLSLSTFVGFLLLGALAPLSILAAQDDPRSVAETKTVYVEYDQVSDVSLIYPKDAEGVAFDGSALMLYGVAQGQKMQPTSLRMLISYKGEDSLAANQVSFAYGANRFSFAIPESSWSHQVVEGGIQEYYDFSFDPSSIPTWRKMLASSHILRMRISGQQSVQYALANQVKERIANLLDQFGSLDNEHAKAATAAAQKSSGTPAVSFVFGKTRKERAAAKAQAETTSTQTKAADVPSPKHESYDYMTPLKDKGLIFASEQPRQVAKKGGTLTIAKPKALLTYNLQIAGDRDTIEQLTPLYADTIARDPQTKELRPVLAESWTLADDGKSVLVALRSDLKWSDGEVLTAKDVVFTANQLLLREDVWSYDRDSYFVSNEDGVQIPVAFELVDDFHYRVSLPSSDALLVELAGIVPMPMHIIAPLIGWDETKGFAYAYEIKDGKLVETKAEGVDYARMNTLMSLADVPSSLVTSGPWRIASYDQGKELVYKPNVHYFEYDAEGVQLPYLDELRVRFVPTRSDIVASFKAGELDIMPVHANEADSLLAEAKKLDIKVYSGGLQGVRSFIAFNQNPMSELAPYKVELLNNAKLRKVFAHLVDRASYISYLAGSYAAPEYACVYAESPYSSEEIAKLAPKFDPATAIAELDALGFRDRNQDGVREDHYGNPLSFKLLVNKASAMQTQMAQLFSNDCAAVGLKVEVVAEPMRKMAPKILKGMNWEMACMALAASIDPLFDARIILSSGDLHVSEPRQEKPRRLWEKEIDRLWAVAAKTPDQAQRKDAYTKIQKLWLQENPLIYTTSDLVLYAAKGALLNASANPLKTSQWIGWRD